MNLKLEIGELFDKYPATNRDNDLRILVPEEKRIEFGDSIITICEKYAGQKLKASQAREAELKYLANNFSGLRKDEEYAWWDEKPESINNLLVAIHSRPSKAYNHYKALKEVADAARSIIPYLSFNQALILNDKLKELDRLEAGDG